MPENYPSTPEEYEEYHRVMNEMADEAERSTPDPLPEDDGGDNWEAEMEAMQEQERQALERMAYDVEYHIYPNQY